MLSHDKKILQIDNTRISISIDVIGIHSSTCKGWQLRYQFLENISSYKHTHVIHTHILTHKHTCVYIYIYVIYRHTCMPHIPLHVYNACIPLICFTHSAAADSIVYVAPWSRLVHTIPPDVSVETTLPLMM